MEIKRGRDLSVAWPVCDGPKKGERLACLHDSFEVLIDPPAGRLGPDRVRYYLCQLDDGGYVWSCTPLV